MYVSQIKASRLLIFIFLGLLTSRTCFANNETLVFPDACAQGQTLVIAAIGDLLMHAPLQRKASVKGYTSLWQAAMPYFRHADLAYANLEGPIARGVNERGKQVTNSNSFDFNIYSDYPLFNYHPKLAKELSVDGIAVVSTANNHALDRSSIGINKTIQELQSVGISFTGTRAENTASSFVTYTQKNNIKIAWIACTDHTNGIDDNHKQVLYCHKKKDKAWILNTIQQLKYRTDAIIITPHWGEEYQRHQNAAQIKFAHEVLNAGALVVIGSHPHVLQPMEKYTTLDGRSTFIIYSMGNFVSNQASPVKRSTIILLIGLTKTADKTIINGIRFVPMYMQNNTGQENLQVNQVSQDAKYALPQSLISSLFPMGNALYSLPIITNPQCTTDPSFVR